MNLQHLTIRPLIRSEFDLVVGWAQQEGWNPGLHDADIFWQSDPDAYIGVELDNELLAAGSIVSYQGEFGFMGFFIVRPELRGKGIGTQLWFHRRDLLISRLKEGASIGMDGVFDMQDWYAKGGFVFSHRNLRMQGIAKKSQTTHPCTHLSEIDFEKIRSYDRRHFDCHRDEFLRLWIEPQEGLALGIIKNGHLVAYGVIRRCDEGFKIGPLFAEEATLANQLFESLSDHAAGETLTLDVPEINANAMHLARQYDLEEVFGCARMYYGNSDKRKTLPWKNIYGITTFELG